MTVAQPIPDNMHSAEEDNLEARIGILGRQRPATFTSTWAECGFCFAVLGSMMMSVRASYTALKWKRAGLKVASQEFFISGFNIILPILASALDIPAQSQTWPASVFSLITGAFLLPFGRLADIYGGKTVFTTGLAWFFIWTLIAGFSQNYYMLNVCRALQGLGPAAFLPSGIMLLGSIYRPGPRKNMVFSLYGACSPVGFFTGIFFAGLSGQYLPWGTYFWIGSALLFVVTVVAFLAVPPDKTDLEKQTAKMDWYGAATIVPGLVLVFYAITDSSHASQGWRTTYILVTFLLGVLFLSVAFYVEGWVAEMPLLPFDLFEVPYMKALLVSLFFSYGTFGIYLFYASF
jgi:MFS family permease